MNSLVGLVAATLAENNISKQKLAEEVGCAPVTLKRKLTGESFLTITEARKLAKALNIDPEEVCRLAPEVSHQKSISLPNLD